MALKVGYVPYLHAEPFYFDMERRGLTLIEMLPSALAAAAENGEIDAGPLPLVDGFRLQDRFEPVAGFGVASVQKTGSVFLYASEPVEALQGARIGVMDGASTSLWLLKILLKLKHQVQPSAYVTLQEPHDAFLVVGNRGLRQRRGVRGFPYQYDLGEAWSQWTGLPFVFSRWLVRQDIDARDKALLEDTLYVALEDGVNAMYQLSSPREALLMLPREVMQYIQGFRYFLRMSEQRAIEQFQDYLTQLDEEER
jgi:chorismate dehydratase